MLKAIPLVLFLLSQQQPTFKSGVELVAVDVHVVDKQGHPISDIRPAEFEVSISGRQRRVVSVELVSYTSGRPTTADVPVTSSPASGTPGERPRGCSFLPWTSTACTPATRSRR